MVPLDNNYTQGQPSAVDGKRRPAPKTPMINNIQKFELGTKNNFAPAALNINTDASQPLIDAMDLIPMAAGGGALALTSQYVNSMGEAGQDIAPEMSKLQRPLAKVFGLSSTVVSKASGTKTMAKKKEEENKSKEDRGENKKGIFDKLKEGFGKFMELLGKKINDADTNGGMGGPGVTGPGVDFSGNEKSVEVPVQQNVLNTFGSTENWSVFRETLASKESGGKYKIAGGSGGQYEGRYQINNAYLGAIANMLGEKAPTREQFRNDPAMQERFMQAYTMDNHRQLMTLSPKYKKMSKEEQMSILGYAHNQGAGAAASWVESGMGAGGKDGFGTAGRWYYENVSANLKRFSSNAAKPKPTTPVAGNPPGALAPGQRPDQALSSEQQRVAVAARAEADRLGLTGKEKDKFVAEKVMAVPSPIFQRPSQESQAATLGEISTNPRQNVKPQIVALNTPGPSQQTSTAGTANPTTAQTATIEKGYNPLKGSGLYIG